MKKSLIAALCLTIVVVSAGCFRPDGSAYPLPWNTGVPEGTALTVHEGNLVFESPGIYENLDVHGCVQVRAPNVTFRTSVVRCATHPEYGAAVTQTTVDEQSVESDNSGFLMEDVEVTTPIHEGADRTTWDSARYGILLDNGGATICRVNIHHTISGIYLAGDDITIEDSYVGDNFNIACWVGNGCDTGDPHASAIGSNGGIHDIVVRNNNLSTLPMTNASSAISLYPEWQFGGPDDNVTITGNILNTGGEYCLYLGHDLDPEVGPPEAPHTNVTFTDNFFGTVHHPNCGSSATHVSFSNHPTNTWERNHVVEFDPSSPNGLTLMTVGPPVPPNLVG